MKKLFPGGEIEVHELSYQDFTDATFVDIPDNVVIYGSCFSCEKPDTSMFREDMKGVTFRNCNLSNVLVPKSNEVIDCQTIRFENQIDGNDWIIDDENKPVKPTDFKYYEKRGLEVPKPESLIDIKK